MTGSGISMTGEAADARHRVVFNESSGGFFLVCGWVSYSCIIVTFDQSGIWLLAKDTFFDQSEIRKFRRVVGPHFFIFINVIFLRVKSVES